jgi:hypothetical protein
LKLGLGLGVGLGLGIPLVLALLGVFFCLRRHQTSTQSDEAHSQMTEGHHGPAPSTRNGPTEPDAGTPSLPDAYRDYSTTGQTMYNTTDYLTVISDEAYNESTPAQTSISPLAIHQAEPVYELGGGPAYVSYATSSGTHTSTPSVAAPSYHTRVPLQRPSTASPESMHSEGYNRNLSSATSAPLLTTYEEDPPPRPYTRFRN